MTFAATTSKFGLPEVKLGLMPDASVTQRLCASIGKYKVLEHHYCQFVILICLGYVYAPPW